MDELDLVQAVLNPRLKLGRAGVVAVESETGVTRDDCIYLSVMHH